MTGTKHNNPILERILVQRLIDDTMPNKDTQVRERKLVVVKLSTNSSTSSGRSWSKMKSRSHRLKNLRDTRRTDVAEVLPHTVSVRRTYCEGKVLDGRHCANNLPDLTSHRTAKAPAATRATSKAPRPASRSATCSPSSGPSDGHGVSLVVNKIRPVSPLF